MTTLVRVADQSVTPWKNGGGTTRSVAIHPVGASLDDFDWRVSIATVASDGPFSRFAGVDRVLVLLSGAGMVLTSPDQTVRLDARGQSWSFPGELDVSGTLVDGPTLDLNVMTRRGVSSATVTIHTLTGPLEASGMVVAIDGALRVDDALLSPGDVAMGPSLQVSGTGQVAEIRFRGPPGGAL
jgi:uncharacterized protein